MARLELLPAVILTGVTNQECVNIKKGRKTLVEHELDDETGGRFAAGYARLMPAVTFGMRAVALAGLVVSAGVAAAGIGGFFDSPASTLLDGPGSSCCSN